MATIKLVAFDFESGATPEGYICKKCGGGGVRLWREHVVLFDNNMKLFCTSCLTAELGVMLTSDDITSLEAQQPGEAYPLVQGFVPAVPMRKVPTIFASLRGRRPNSEPRDLEWWFELPIESAA